MEWPRPTSVIYCRLVTQTEIFCTVLHYRSIIGSTYPSDTGIRCLLFLCGYAPTLWYFLPVDNKNTQTLFLFSYILFLTFVKRAEIIYHDYYHY